MGLLGNGAIGLLLDIIGQPFRVDFRVAIYMMDKYLSLLFSFSRSAQSPRFVFPILIPFPIPFIHHEKCGFAPCASGRIGRMRRTGKESFNMTTGCN